WVVYFHLIEARLRGLDVGEMLEDRAVFKPGDRGGDENPEMPDMRVGEVDDALAGGSECRSAGIDRGYPAEGLVGWRNIVAVGCKDHQRTSNALEIGDAMRVNPDRPLLKPVADEKIFDDGHHLLAAQP